MDLYLSPSYHYISPLARSRSDVRTTPTLKRTQSYSYGSSSFTRPSYGYGGGYMARSLSRSGSSLFGRSLQSSIVDKVPPFHSVGVQRSTPHYTDKYPYVRYSYGNFDTSLGIAAQSDALSGGKYSTIRDMGTRRWLEGKLNTYHTGLFSTSDYLSRPERPVTPVRNYIRYMPIDDALNMYKKRCMTVGTLSKYWLSPSTWQSRREQEYNLGSSVARGNYSYTSRYTGYSSRPSSLSSYSRYSSPSRYSVYSSPSLGLSHYRPNY